MNLKQTSAIVISVAMMSCTNKIENHDSNSKKEQHRKRFEEILRQIPVYNEKLDEKKNILDITAGLAIKLNNDTLRIGDTLRAFVYTSVPLNKILVMCAELNQNIKICNEDLQSIPIYTNVGYFKTCVKDTGCYFINAQVLTKTSPVFSICASRKVLIVP